MNKEFIPYELALKLVELGFNEKTFDVYSDIITQGFKVIKKPTPKIIFQQAFRFFREKYDLDSLIIRSFSMNHSYHYDIIINQDYETDYKQVCIPGRSYEQAQLDCLKKLIEIVGSSK